MARGADVILEWGPGEYQFRLLGAQIEALEAECHNPATGKDGIGLGAIFQRVMDGGWYLRDLRNVIRHGLIGGGMGAVEANRLCRDYIDAMPVPISGMPPGPNSTLAVAQSILVAAVIGVDPDGEKPEDGPAPDEPNDFGKVRAMLLEFGVDPRATDTMTLAEIEGMMRALRENREAASGNAMTPEAFEELKESMRATQRPDEVF